MSTWFKIYCDTVIDRTKKLGTLRVYQSVQRVVAAWQPNLLLGDLTSETLVEFERWLVTQGASNGTIKAYVTRFKAFAKWVSLQHNLQTNIHTHKRETTVQPRAHILFLQALELNQLIRTSMPSTTLDDVRNMMVLMCFTGLRFSDAHQLRAYHIQEEDIVLTTLKTQTPVRVPLNPISRQILERYNYELPTFTHSYFAREIKTVARLAGLDRTVVVGKRVGTVDSIETIPLHEAITAHWGRRTFTTHCLAKKVNPAVLKQWLGHARLEQLLSAYAGAVNQKREMKKVFN